MLRTLANRLGGARLSRTTATTTSLVAAPACSLQQQVRHRSAVNVHKQKRRALKKNSAYRNARRHAEKTAALDAAVASEGLAQLAPVPAAGFYVVGDAGAADVGAIGN
jgi:hypothetical protein